MAYLTFRFDQDWECMIPEDHVIHASWERVKKRMDDMNSEATAKQKTLALAQPNYDSSKTTLPTLSDEKIREIYRNAVKTNAADEFLELLRDCARRRNIELNAEMFEVAGLR